MNIQLYLPFICWSLAPIILIKSGNMIYLAPIIYYIVASFLLAVKKQWPITLWNTMSVRDKKLYLISSVCQVVIEIAAVLTLLENTPYVAASFVLGSLWSIPYYFTSKIFLEKSPFKMKEVIIIFLVAIGVGMLYDLQFTLEMSVLFGMIRLIAGTIAATITKGITTRYQDDVVSQMNWYKIYTGLPLTFLILFFVDLSIIDYNIGSLISIIIAGILISYVGHGRWPQTIKVLSPFKINTVRGIFRALVFLALCFLTQKQILPINIFGIILIFIGNILAVKNNK